MAFTAQDPQAPQQFLRYAHGCIEAAKKSYGFDLSYDLTSIKALDQMVDGIGKPKNLEGMILTFGSFLGEALRQLYKGKWQWSEQFKTWGITFPLPNGKEDSAFVFAKVQKRFLNGTQDSLGFFAEVIDARVKGKVP